MTASSSGRERGHQDHEQRRDRARGAAAASRARSSPAGGCRAGSGRDAAPAPARARPRRCRPHSTVWPMRSSERARLRGEHRLVLDDQHVQARDAAAGEVVDAGIAARRGWFGEGMLGTRSLEGHAADHTESGEQQPFRTAASMPRRLTAWNREAFRSRSRGGARCSGGCAWKHPAEWGIYRRQRQRHRRLARRLRPFTQAAMITHLATGRRRASGRIISRCGPA